MESNRIRLYSSIKAPLKRQVLFRGTVLAFIGVLFLLWASIYLLPPELDTWGLVILLISSGLIIYGLLPYRKLTYLENHPNEIIMDSDASVHIIFKRKLMFSVPHFNWENFEYIEKKDMYGIGMHLELGDLEKIVIYDQRFDIVSYQKESLKNYNCDLFLPYFTKKSYNLLIS